MRSTLSTKKKSELSKEPLYSKRSHFRSQQNPPGSVNMLELLRKEIRRVEHNLEEVEEFYKSELKWFDHLSDSIAKIGGSWTFIISFIAILILWMFLNAYILVTPFDHYPFILLNLLLSCVAALQGPIILMSQNRASKRDQTRIELDLEKDVRDLKVDEHSLTILKQLQKDVQELKKKVG